MAKKKPIPLHEAKKSVFETTLEAFEDSTGQLFTECLIKIQKELQARATKQE